MSSPITHPRNPASTQVLYLPDEFLGLQTKTTFWTLAGVVAVILVVAIGSTQKWFSFDFSTWTLGDYFLALLALVLVGVGIEAWQRPRHRRELLARVDQWRDKSPRTQTEILAATLAVTALRLRNRERGERVKQFLAEVGDGGPRVIVVADLLVQPGDDGTLWEEANVLERRAFATPWLLILFVVVPAGWLFITASMRSGFDPRAWDGNAWMNAGMAVFMSLSLLLGYGILYSPGLAVFASPRRIVHTSTFGRTHTFTPDDSVVLITTFSAVHVTIVRSDGLVRSLSISGPAQPGFANLINRWCMSPTQPPRAAPVAEAGA
jgi:hypothetical protein